MLLTIKLYSQTANLNYDANKIAHAYEILQLNPADSLLQLNYINSFPQNWSTL